MDISKQDKRKRIGIFSIDDKTWLFPAFTRAMPIIIEEHDLVGIYLFPDMTGKHKGIQILKYYLKTFGLCNFLIMSLYAIKTRILNYFKSIKSWKQLALKYNFELCYGNTPNSKAVCEWVRKKDIDIILIAVGHILKEEVIMTPKIGIINKHAGLIPTCRGLFPHFWSKLHNIPTGITFHQVDNGIDTGKIILQVRYPDDEFKQLSMLRYYIDVFYLFSYLVTIAIDKLLKNDFSESSITGSSSNYFSLPEKQNYIDYKNKKYKISRFSDLFYRPRIDIEGIIDEIRSNKSQS